MTTMRVQLAFAVVLIGVAALVQPSLAEACGCGGTASSATAFKRAEVVFVGTVARLEGPKPWSRVNADGSVSGGLGVEPLVATFEVTHVFLGRPARTIVIIGDATSCNIPFRQGETFEPLQAIAVGKGGRVEITTDKWGAVPARAATR